MSHDEKPETPPGKFKTRADGRLLTRKNLYIPVDVDEALQILVIKLKQSTKQSESDLTSEALTHLLNSHPIRKGEKKLTP